MTEHKPWLSLPDEEPPERGLAELMAAARAKAEIMASPPWWKRALALARRPPVLALATVVVLVGGVIIVHREPAEVSSPVASPPTAPETAPAEPAGFGVAQPPPPAVTEPHVETKHVTTHAVMKADTQKAEIAAPNDDGNERGAVAPNDDGVEHGAVAPNDDGVERGAVAPKQPSDELARCRTAAARKDCAGARACAKQLEAESPQFYKANVANDATLKPCL
jgi:hypothetical protein